MLSNEEYSVVSSSPYIFTTFAKITILVLQKREGRDSTQNHCPAEHSRFFQFEKSRFFVCSEFCASGFCFKTYSSVLPALQLPLPPHFSKVGSPKSKSVNKYFAPSYHFQFHAEHFWHFSFVASRCYSS